MVERVTSRPRSALRARPWRTFTWRVRLRLSRLGQLDEAAFDAHLTGLAHRLRRARAHPGERLLAEALATVCSAAERTLGIRPYWTQMLGARAVLNGAVAEMQTGEGKTLALALAAGCAALGGRKVHLITANDYLAGRDAVTMRPLYTRLGLTVDAVEEGMDAESRRRVFSSDIVYASGKEVAFTFLRDRVAMGSRTGDLDMRMRAFLDDRAFLMPGLQFAIVDEADSVMIDEARTPLILSVPPGDIEVEAETARGADRIAATLTEGRHFRLDRSRHQVELTDRGRAAVADAADQLPEGWRVGPLREDAVRTALSARHMHALGEHYILRDGKVEIVDEYTGRVMPDRSWSAGLHQAVEAKEGVEITARRVTLAQITFQRFFRRYLHVGGMTGTAREAAGEFWEVYRLPVVSIPTYRRSRRETWRTRIAAQAETKWRRVARRAERLARAGRPVLIGTRTVAASDAASAALQRLGVPHRVLSAEQDADEAAIVAEAGRAGAVTVATNMAGRGTDIVLDARARAAGGLHVIMTERHTARRIDRQLAGRAGRQGDPGSWEAILSAEDPLLMEFGGRLARRMARFGGAAAARAMSAAQARAETRHARARRQLLELDEKMAEHLSFTGTPE
ncbi:Preprotein translocase subunit SecA (ATPase, RNA helicase) [Wenxinia marina DSM 24838]|uniref:Protein translocase subunit SecA n=1 Tax=Wenxinia marina DSM 24838 TaxID=1123501 RepID=A0A0D0PCW9_9RHOB|nr:Preprotein translocase subunit SecA (ATPase, RNA helicase) [Wenxinia marina DSM 24838]